jgi:hypothetical protein
MTSNSSDDVLAGRPGYRQSSRKFLCLPGSGSRLSTCLGRSPGRGRGLFATRRIGAEKEVSRIYGELLDVDGLAAIEDDQLRSLVESDAICNAEGLCVSPRNPRTGRRLRPPGGAFLGVYVNEPADELPKGMRPVRAPRHYRGPFRSNVYFNETIYELAKDLTSFRKASRASAASPRRRRFGFTSIISSAPLERGEELSTCYDSGQGASQGLGYGRKGYARPKCCWEDQERCLARPHQRA